MFRKMILAAVLSVITSCFFATTSSAQDDQTWKLGILITSLGGGDRGCVLNQVFDNSPAKEIGLEPGDVLLTVNGQFASNTQNVRNTVFANDSVQLVLKRGNSYFQKDVTFTPAIIGQQDFGNGPVPVMVKQKSVKTVKTQAVQAPKLPPAKPLPRK